MKKTFIIIALMLSIPLFFSCTSQDNPNPITTSITEEIIPPTNLYITVDSNDYIELHWDDLSQNEAGYLIEKLNISTLETDSVYLPSNSTSYYDNNISTSFEYKYRVGVISRKDTITFSNYISIKYTIKYVDFLEFSAQSDYSRYALSFSQDEKFLASATDGKIFDLNNKTLIKTLRPNICNLACDFNGNNQVLLTSTLYDVFSETEIAYYSMPYSILRGKVSKNGAYVGLVSSDIFGGRGAVRIYSIEGDLLLSYSSGYFYNFSNSSETFLYSPSQGRISVIRVSDGSTVVSKAVSPGNISDAVFSPDDNLIAITSYSQKVMVWNYTTDEILELETATDHYNYTKSVNFTNDGKYLICGSNSREISFWDVNSGQFIKNVASYGGDVLAIAVSASDKYIAAYGGRVVKVQKKESTWEIFK